MPSDWNNFESTLLTRGNSWIEETIHNIPDIQDLLDKPIDSQQYIDHIWTQLNSDILIVAELTLPTSTPHKRMDRNG